MPSIYIEFILGMVGHVGHLVDVVNHFVLLSDSIPYHSLTLLNTLVSRCTKQRMASISNKIDTSPINEIKDEHSFCVPVYTDGSKDNDRVGCAAIINNISIKQRLPSNASIFTAEIKAIDLALSAITENGDDHFIIFSDLLSTLLSLNNKKLENPWL